MRRASRRLVGTLALGIFAAGATGCESYRHEYSDARGAKQRYRDCLDNNPGDPEACEAQRRAASDEYGAYKQRTRSSRGCDTNPDLCRGP